MAGKNNISAYMPKLPVLKPKEVITLLQNNGFLRKHTTGSHYIFFHPDKHNIVSVPYHSKDMPKGTLLSILKQAGIDRNEID